MSSVDNSDNYGSNDEIDDLSIRKKKTLTKEQILYGIWAESDEETEILASNHKDSTILHQPINFVSSVKKKKSAIEGKSPKISA